MRYTSKDGKQQASVLESAIYPGYYYMVLRERSKAGQWRRVARSSYGNDTASAELLARMLVQCQTN